MNNTIPAYWKCASVQFQWLPHINYIVLCSTQAENKNFRKNYIHAQLWVHSLCKQNKAAPMFWSHDQGSEQTLESCMAINIRTHLLQPS